jgi:hypothetical protein
MIEDAALMFIKEQCVEECDATKPIKVIMPGYKKILKESEQELKIKIT